MDLTMAPMRYEISHLQQAWKYDYKYHSSIGDLQKAFEHPMSWCENKAKLGNGHGTDYSFPGRGQ
jgi:hypothetical protein